MLIDWEGVDADVDGDVDAAISRSCNKGGAFNDDLNLISSSALLLSLFDAWDSSSDSIPEVLNLFCVHLIAFAIGDDVSFVVSCVIPIVSTLNVWIEDVMLLMLF
jgi:hypothetical protein